MTNNFDSQIKDPRGYRGNSLLKKPGTQIEWTQEMISEYIKCSQDPIYFIKKYIKVIHVDHGLVPLNLYEYQEDLILKAVNHRNVIACTSRQAGKALPLDMKIPTPNGFVNNGDLKVGDQVFSDKGKIIKVSAVSKIFHNHQCFKITFDDKTTVVADAEHLWVVKDRWNKHKEVQLTTQQLFSDKYFRNKKKTEYKYYIENTKPVEYETKSVKIDPYLLGLWLGDGCTSGSRFTSSFEDLEFYKTQNIQFSKNYAPQKTHYEGNIPELQTKLRGYGLLGNKVIPNEYLFNDVKTRIALLQGIMDTDGWVSKDSGICYIQLSTKRNPELLNSLYSLLVSLGLKVTTKEFEKTNSRRFSFSIARDDFDCFRLQRKLVHQKQSNKLNRYVNSRTIQKIENVESVPTRCIEVDDSRHMFLCSENYIPTHNTTSIVGFAVWYVIFNSDKDVGILANKGSSSRKILASIKLAYTYIPKWLQVGVVEWNKGSVILENNSRIVAEATSSDSVRGWSFSVILIDEAAFVKNWEEFSASVLPTISSGQTTKLILLSTPNGLNSFHKTWQDSIEGRNDFQRVEVPWYKVSGRDEKWKQKTLADLNFNIEKFQVEYECSFQGSSGTLISGSKLTSLVHRTPIAQKDGLTQYATAEKDHSYVMLCDVSEGKGLDYSTIQVIDTTKMPYQQVCSFKSNMITPTDFAAKIFYVGKIYNDASCLIEINSIGETVSYILHNEFEYPNILRTENAGRSGKKITHRMGKNIDNGIRVSTSTKATGCSLLKIIIEADQLIINDHATIEELSRFSRKGRSYEAESGYHDDLVMPLVIFSWLTDQKYFKEYTSINTIAAIRETTEDENIQSMANFGCMTNGLDQTVETVVEQGLVWTLIQ